LIGARNVGQLDQALNALKVLPKLTPEVEAKINKLIGTTPEARLNFLQWKQYDPIRPVEK
jgi:aryl-alcohol dehydrogenase-like predicted oxidoreductase